MLEYHHADLNVYAVVGTPNRLEYALGFFVKLWKRIRKVDGSMAFCNVSAHEQEVLRVTRLDTLWPVCTSREQAVEQLRQTGGSSPSD